jgi:hypothetical protein
MEVCIYLGWVVQNNVLALLYLGVKSILALNQLDLAEIFNANIN